MVGRVTHETWLSSFLPDSATKTVSPPKSPSKKRGPHSGGMTSHDSPLRFPDFDFLDFDGVCAYVYGHVCGHVRVDMCVWTCVCGHVYRHVSRRVHRRVSSSYSYSPTLVYQFCTRACISISCTATHPITVQPLSVTVMSLSLSLYCRCH